MSKKPESSESDWKARALKAEKGITKFLKVWDSDPEGQAVPDDVIDAIEELRKTLPAR